MYTKKIIRSTIGIKADAFPWFDEHPVFRETKDSCVCTRVCEQPLCVRNSQCYHRCYRHRRLSQRPIPGSTLVCMRAQERDRMKRERKREREMFIWMYIYIRIRKLWRHLRPSDQSENALRVRFAHCSADVCNTKASWCDGPGCSIRLTVQFFTFIFVRFYVKVNIQFMINLLFIIQFNNNFVKPMQFCSTIFNYFFRFINCTKPVLYDLNFIKYYHLQYLQ